MVSWSLMIVILNFNKILRCLEKEKATVSGFLKINISVI